MRKEGNMKISTARIASVIIPLLTIAVTVRAVPSSSDSQSTTPENDNTTPSSTQWAASPDNDIVQLSDTSFVYNGEMQSPTVLVGEEGEFTEGTDYTVSGVRSAKDAGSYAIEISGLGENSFNITKEWKITKKSIIVKPTDTSKHIGTVDPTLTFTLEGIIEGDTLLGLSAEREAGESVGTYTIHLLGNNDQQNYLLDMESQGTFTIEGHQYTRGENAVMENVILPTCTEDGSHDEVYYCQFDSCGAECLRIHMVDSAMGHDFSESFTTDVPATCERAGSKSRHCTRCYQKIENTIIPATGHSWSEGYVNAEPTCTEPGELIFYCNNSNCQETRTEEIAPIEHTYVDSFTVDFPATCEEEGQESRHCSVCDAMTDIRIIPALGHSWNNGTIDTKPTCVTPGVKIFRCTVSKCKGIKEEEIEALGHDFIEEFITDTFPTCTKPGRKSWHCTRCTEVDNVTEIPARGHRWNDGDTIAFPNCEERGVIIYTCNIQSCGATDTVYIPALGHLWDEGIISKEATCTEKGTMFHTCTRTDCGETMTTEINALGHDYNPEYTIDMPATCTRSGRKSQHCSRCSSTINSTLIQATGHSWGNPTTIIPSTCTTSGIVSYACTNDNCQQTRTQVTEKLGHEFASYYTVDIPATCTQQGRKTIHCIRCDEKIEPVIISATGHLAGDTIIDRDIAATCTAHGEVSRAVFCVHCQKELWRATSETPAIGHNWDEGEFVIAPTTENMGKKVFTCLNCQSQRYELVEKLYKTIIMREFTDGSIFSVKSEGYCPGSEDYVGYTVLEGIPVEYKVDYTDAAKKQGFEDVDWTSVSADSRIAITPPGNCEAGTYHAYITFRGENLATTIAYPLTFTVNLNKSYMVAIFDDVVSIDNRNNLFHTFQWYHNGKMIDGATKPYYQEMGGLTGSYYVRINMGTGAEARTCSRDVWDKIVQKTRRITVSQNPIQEGTTVVLHNFEDTQHTLTVINDLGTTLITERFTENSIRLNANRLPAGNYIINVDGISLKVIKE